MKQLMPPAPTQGFAQYLMLIIWQDRARLRAGETDDYDNLAVAVYSLRQMTGLPSPQLAARLCIDNYKLGQLEKRGGPVTPEDLERMQKLAKDSYLFKLAEYFKRAKLLYHAKHKRGRRPTDV